MNISKVLQASHVFGLVICLLLSAASISSPARAQQEPSITVSFDEAGLVGCADFTSYQVDVYVVGLRVDEVGGYEFELLTTQYPSFLLGKTLYGAEQLITVGDYEVRARTNECMYDPTLMGPNPWTWTLTRFELGYFTGIGNDVYFCVDKAPSSEAATPEFALCYDAGTVPAYPLLWDPYTPAGCAIANPTMGPIDCDRRTIDTSTTSWGALKSQY